ncbi:alpha/beta fold hydrolase [Streptomyces sp. NPDC014733]|uniref:alpha/beta fold hydrolase n=1 Tax=Streptomyces sp. NPDC014733 TaxID=3364885 RepID=UPI0036FB392F
MPQSVPSPQWTHRLVDTPDGRLHLVEQGSGPLVLLLHGFPESWYSWRHQLPALAAAGYHAAALDLRGYGRSARPAAVEAYDMAAHVADNAAVIRALGARDAVLVGHDWGSPIAAHTALRRPDVCSAVALLSVPYAPRGPVRPSDAFAALGGDEEFYVRYFQEPGRAEAEIEPDIRSWLAGFYASLSGDTLPADGSTGHFFVPPGGRLRDRFVRDRTPSWLGDTELDFYTAEFTRTGLTGALNRYRNADRDWAAAADLEGAPIAQPSLFVGGTRDASTTWLADAIDAFPTTLPGLAAAHLLDGCGHWIQQERPDEVNRLLLDWLRGLDLA